MIRGVVAAVMGAATLTAVTFTGITPAQASEIRPTGISAGIPPSALMGCNLPLADTGGWMVRDVLSNGTSSEDPAPVRPRSARFYEPCFDTTGFSDAPLNIPVHLTDIPVPMLDEDDDGMDDGAPALEDGGRCSNVSAPENITRSLIEAEPYGCVLIPMHVRASGSGDTLGITSQHISWTLSEIPEGVRVTVTALNRNNNLPPYADVLAAPPGQVQIGRYGFTGYCVQTGTNAFTLAGSVADQLIPGSSFTSDYTPAFTCAASENRYLHSIIAISAPLVSSETVPWGVAWRYDDLPIEGSDGTGYYGGTQAAQYAIGASTSFTGVQYNANVVCSTDYTGTNRTTHAMTTKNPGDFDNVDKSPEPPIMEDGVAVAWDGKYNWYPTNVLAGGVYASNCPFLLEVNMWVCVYSDRGPTNYGCLEQKWDSERYRTKHPYTGTDGDSPAEVICLIFPDLPGCYAVNNPDSLDEAIVCEINATGEFFEWIVSWITLLPDWIGCMTTPEGWDRSNALGRGWEASKAGQMQRAFYNSMPSNIGCGVVAQVPFDDSLITLDTCEMDVAPDWVKTALGWVLILGLAGLSLRRIMWAIGGNK